MFGIRLRKEVKERENVGLNHQSLLDEEQAEDGVKLKCRDCGEVFLFSAGENKFYQVHGLRTTTRCPICRKWKRHEREEEAEQDRRNGGNHGNGN